MKLRSLLFGLVLLATTASVHAQRKQVPFDDPDAIRFDESKFRLPDPAAYREELGEGLVAFVAADETTPVVHLSALIGASRMDDPTDQAGLAEAVATAVRSGSPTLTGPSLSDALYEMGASLSAVVDAEHTRITMSFLREDLSRAIDLFASVLRAPRIDDETLERFRASATRPPWNPDDPRRRPELEFSRLLYGDHPAARRVDGESAGRISVEDVRAFHDRFYVPNNVVIAVSGGFTRADAVARLKESLFREPWHSRAVEHAEVSPVSEPGARKIHAWDVDRLQGWAVIGHLGVTGRASDRAALEVANYVLGGGGAVWKRVHPDLPPTPAEGHFDARLFNESRAKRGLTNDTSSYVPVGFRAPAPIYAVTLGRPESMGYLFKIVVDEWTKIREDISAEDVEIAKGALTEGYFQMRYAGADQTALSLAEELFFEGGHDWARSYERAIGAVTKQRALAAARKYYRPEALFAALVGPIDEIVAAEHPLHKAKLLDFGELIRHEW